MAVADAALPSPPMPPPSAWIVLVALALVRLALTPMLVLVRFALMPMLVLVGVLCVPAGALACLFFATAWVTSMTSLPQSWWAALSEAPLPLPPGDHVWGVQGLRLQLPCFPRACRPIGVRGLRDCSCIWVHFVIQEACVMIPTVVLGLWRDCQADRKAPSQEAAKKHHHLDLNTLGGHTDCITMLDFSSDACNLATDDPFLKALEETPFLQPSKMTYP
ncbi:hypothetical protein ZWY2020_030373 [Hordeum vulgare]|nr:hypothetical protein ZWY2020_030373 [Hordeum vulgare]